MRLLVLLAFLQTGCLAESDPVEVAVECGPRDLTPECCLKENPGAWERCTGTSAHSVVTKVVATGVAVAVASQPQINSAEQRGTQLAADLLTKVERAIEQCVRKADREVNDYHFHGRSPNREICQQIKLGERTTWAAYLGLFKHEQSWPCLDEALGGLLSKKRYLLHPRFRPNDQTGQWEFLDEEMVRKIVSEQGWKGLKGTIEPDIIIMDEKGFILHVYDLQFPCPDTKPAAWSRYEDGRWKDWSQGELYKKALQVTPQLVSPKYGVQTTERQ